MPVTKDEAKQKIAELVAKYEALSSSQVKAFNEANTKQGFIEPLFKALGWDVDDTNEVTLEENVSNKRVDYAFKLHGVSQFYLEAKPLKADLTNRDYIKQAVTYAYNKGVTWVVLTDFERSIVYAAQTGEPFLTLSCDKYLADFDDLWLLSKESFRTNALIEKAEKYGKLPPRLGVEQRLFGQLRQWRGALSGELLQFNENLNFGQIDEIIQRLFNRLIFIRTAEDRGIEDKRLRSMVNQWKSSGRKGELVEELRKLFREFDGYYDSELFAPHLVDKAYILGTTLEAVIEGLYEIRGGVLSYDFSVIDADVLGTVYEQYLGYVAGAVKQKAKEAQTRLDLGILTETISLTEKKERRKEHGIYYTPKFVTDYIVKETVGRFIKEHTYNEILNIKILDPACGSGSFLIRAYDELLAYHANQRGKPISELGQWERISILTNNIFGVDLDMQAVEIARLNLLLRSLAKRETLPGLKDNIRRGNSLISGTDEELKKYFGDDWENKKPFNWEHEFKDIMDNGGFDIVIGNPPYIPMETMDDNEKNYFKQRYPQLERKYDSSIIFILTLLKKLKPTGRLSFISSITWQTGENYQKLREYLFTQAGVDTLVNLPFDVFASAYVDTGIYILSPELTDGYYFYSFAKKAKTPTLQNLSYTHITRELITAPSYKIILDSKAQALLARFSDKERYDLLGNFTISTQGLAGNRFSIRDVFVGDDSYPFLVKGQVYRYELQTNQVAFVDLSEHASLKSYYNKRPKILIRRVINRQDRLMATYVDEKLVFKKDINPFVISNLEWNSLFVLGLLNSRLISYLYINTSSIATKDDFRQTTLAELRRIPIRRINFDDPKEKIMHNKIVGLVERMLELSKRIAPIRDIYGYERDELLSQVKKTDKEIDNLVYDLYGLTEEERQVIEGSVSKA